MLPTLLLSAAFAQAPSPEPAQDPAQAPPSAVPWGEKEQPPIATVLSHQVSVTIDGNRRLSETVTWQVRIDDPQSCSAGVLAPPGLDGASDKGAQILEDLLVIPAETEAGAIFTLKRTRTAPPGPHSGVFYTAPDLPTEHASLTVAAPSWVPLTLWADPEAAPTHRSGGLRTVTMQWPALPAGTLGQAAWSSFSDWPEASRALTQGVAGKLADSLMLGKELALDTGMGVSGITQAVFDAIQLDPHTPGTWEGARPAASVVRSGAGTAAERGLVLLSMLKLAGMDASAGYYRPSQAPGNFPITVPAPALLYRPVVVVRRQEGLLYIDPAASRTALPDRPASLLGATVWIPGELPAKLHDEGVVDGSVTITTHLALEQDGSANWKADVSAAGAAQEYLRELLSPLDELARMAAVERLVKQARPRSRVTVQVTGVDSTTRPFSVVVTGHDEDVLSSSPMGLTGRIAPVLAPALGAWLPPRLRLTETVAITPPASTRVLGTLLDPGRFRQEALVERSRRREGERVLLTAEVERPYRHTSPAMAASAAQFLEEEAALGVTVLVSGQAERSTVQAIRADGQWTAAERAVLEALLWHGVDSDKKAGKVWTRALKLHSPEALVAGLGRFLDGSDTRPFEGLSAALGTDDRGRVAIARQLAELGARTKARALAESLADSNDALVRVQALLLLERLMPRPEPYRLRPGATSVDTALLDKHRALLDRAEQAANGLGTEHLQEIRLRRAELLLDAGDPPGALASLEGLPELPATVLLRASATGRPLEEVRDTVRAAVAAHPQDTAVVAAAARALERVGDHAGALSLALDVARMAQNDPDLWAAVVAPALGTGELPTAAYAARKASDLDPDDAGRASTWATLATLMLSKEEVDKARARAGLPPVSDWPPSVDDRMSLDEAALLAVLEHAEDAVSADPRLLAIRAQLRIAGVALDGTALDGAARDGLVLATRHGTPEGYALAFAATAGRQYSTSLLRALDQAAASEPTATLTRMEYRLVAGAGDPLEDARRLGDDPRAQTVLQWLSSPAKAAATLPGWPAALRPPPGQAPAGYRPNRALSVLPGVKGWSNAEAGMAVVRVGARADSEGTPAPTGILPPPFGLLYVASPQVVASLPGGARLLRLDGGVMPLYAATAPAQDAEIWGFGFTAEAAKRALAAGQL